MSRQLTTSMKKILLSKERNPCTNQHSVTFPFCKMAWLINSTFDWCRVPRQTGCGYAAYFWIRAELGFERAPPAPTWCPMRLSLTLDLTHSCNIPPGRGSRHYVPPAHLRQVSERNTSFGYASALRTAVGLSLKSILTCGSRIMSHWLNCTSTCSVAMYVL